LSRTGHVSVTSASPAGASVAAMSDFARYPVPVETTEELWDWWSTLNADQQDLLRITASSVPISPYVVDFLVQSRCPAVIVGPGGGPARVADLARFTGFVAHA
jgi:hypothetical protein